jgi:regulatory protein
MQITAIKQQVKNPERVSIFVDGKYSFSLNLNELMAEKLKNDEEIDGSRLKKLKKLSEDGKLRMRGLEWVMNRPHSTREFRDYMFRKKADPALTDELIAEFSTKKYLDDLAYGQWLLEIRQRAGKSNRAIKAELFKKGLDREQVELVLQQSGSEAERLRLVIAKKSQLARYRDDPQKLKMYLLRQGYDYDLVRRVVDGN